MSVNCLAEKSNLMLIKKQKRREKSRDAARCRRHKESDTFEEICDSIPVSHEILSHLDKSAIMRLLISFIKLRQVMNIKDDALSLRKVVKQEVTSEGMRLKAEDYVNALNGFLFILSSDLDLLYVSNNVKDYLGLSKFDLMGQSVLAYTHEGDHDDLKDCFDQKKGVTSFFLRLKSTLTVNGKSINLKSASYKVVRCRGIVCDGAGGEPSYLVAYAEPLPHPANIELLMDSMTFVTRHSPDMKFSECDDRFSQLLGYDESDMIKHSFFDFCHVADLKSLGENFHKLYRLNQVESNQYRFLAKNGGYYWMVTQASVITAQKSHKAQHIVCVHYVISGLEEGECALSVDQMDSSSSAHQLLDSGSKKQEDASVLEEDGCSFAPLTITELDDTDKFLSEDLFYNAPSIGDPWAYAENPSTSMDEILSQNLFDNEQTPDQRTKPSPAYSPMLLDSPVSSQSTLPSSNSPWSDSYPITPGSVSPCDSAYGGSPRQDMDKWSCGFGKPSDPSPQATEPAWQTVEIPVDQFNRHMNSLKRACLEPVGDPDNRMKRSKSDKRRCLNSSPPRAMPFKSLLHKSGVLAGGWDVAKNAAMLVQPGGSVGCGDTDLLLVPSVNANFLLQPELNLQGKSGQQMIRNLSSGFLPELSVRDCEVNAPLAAGQERLPLAMECVNLLDSEV